VIPTTVPTTPAPDPTTTAPSPQQTQLPVVNDSPSSAPVPSASVTSSTATTPASPLAGGSGTPAAGGQVAAQAAGVSVAQSEGEVSLRAQTAAAAPAADPTASNAFFASGALMLLGAFIPKFARRTRGRHV
jgi:hypothetical protein